MKNNNFENFSKEDFVYAIIKITCFITDTYFRVFIKKSFKTQLYVLNVTMNNVTYI